MLEMWGQEDTALLGGNSCLFDFVCCGGLHTIAIRDGFVYSWGRGEGGQLGHPVTMLKQKRKEETTEFYIDRPLKINGIKDAIKAVCGDAHSIVLTKDG